MQPYESISQDLQDTGHHVLHSITAREPMKTTELPTTAAHPSSPTELLENVPAQTAAIASGDVLTATPSPILTPAVNAAYTLAHWANPGEGDIDSLIVGLAAQARALREGDLTDAERMLMAHASALDVIFNQLARKAALNAGVSISTCDAYLRLALKARSQCRTTLETLSWLKSPRSVSFVRQANIAHGPQQVNNGNQPIARPKKRKSAKRTIEVATSCPAGVLNAENTNRS